MRRGVWRARVRGLCCSLGALGVVACGSSGAGPGDEGEPQLTSPLVVTDMNTFSLPLDSYRFQPANLSLTRKADSVLVDQCLRRFGFDPPPPTVIPTSTGTGNGQLFGIVDEERAKTRGYHGPVQQPEDVAEAERDQERWTPAMRAVATGQGQSTHGGQAVPEGGCYGEASRELAEGSPAPANEQLGDELSAQAHTRAQQDSRVRKAFTEWSACMNRAGYDYTEPSNANNDPRWWTDRNTSTPDEIAVATADVRCKREVNLISRWATVETAYQKRLLDRNAEALAMIKRSFEARERNAAAVLAGQ